MKKTILLGGVLLTSLTASVRGEEKNEHPFSISFEYLYWKAVQDQLPYAAVLPGGIQQIIQTLSNQQNGPQLSERLEIKNQDFEFNSGLRVGVEYDLPHSNWGFSLSWETLHEGTSSRAKENGGIIPIAVPVSSIFAFIGGDPSQFAFASCAESHWKLRFDAVDFTISRQLQSKKLHASPYLGLKAARINQKQHIEYDGFSAGDTPINIETKKKNYFHGLGPLLGIHSSWEFYNHIYLTGNLGAALLFGRFHVLENPSASQDPFFIEFKLKDHICNRVRPYVDAKIGVDWMPYVGKSVALTVGAAYEVQYWWNQWQVPASVVGSAITGGVSPQGDLMLYGYTFKVALSF